MIPLPSLATSQNTTIPQSINGTDAWSLGGVWNFNYGSGSTAQAVTPQSAALPSPLLQSQSPDLILLAGLALLAFMVLKK